MLDIKVLRIELGTHGTKDILFSLHGCRSQFHSSGRHCGGQTCLTAIREMYWFDEKKETVFSIQVRSTVVSEAGRTVSGRWAKYMSKCSLHLSFSR